MAFTDEHVAYFKHRGFALRVINRTNENVNFMACDSAISILCEARDGSGKWREIESPPQIICGNSIHRVILGAGQYWEFPAREYAGSLKTRLRFRLDPGNGKPAVYSNEFDGRISESQFEDGA